MTADWLIQIATFRAAGPYASAYACPARGSQHSRHLGVVLTARFELVSQSSGRWLYIVVREELILPHASLSLQPSTRPSPWIPVAR